MKHNDARVWRTMGNMWEVRSDFTFGNESLTLFARKEYGQHNYYCFILRFNAPSVRDVYKRLTACGFGETIRGALEDLCKDVVSATHVDEDFARERLFPLLEPFIWADISRSDIFGDG